ncbi:DnaJ-domain-containing protein [Rhodotorula sp. JG-1b]|nr:DnaJ-domain-containing protein [Rhodotorula sp. JG-1b]
MVLLGYATAAASTAGSYAYAAASSYVFRSDASTSNAARSTAERDQHHRDRADSARSTFFDSSSTAASPSSPSSNASKRLSVRLTEPPHVRLPSAASAAPTAGLPRGDAEDLVDEINVEENLYKILGVKRRAKTDEVRRAFLARSRIIHPDKLPFYAPSTTAFQRLSFAYETLSKPSSRRLYDLRGPREFDPAKPKHGPPAAADETLNGVLRNVISEFLSGDFEMIRVFVTALNEGNPGLNVGDDTVESIESVFRRLREALLAGQRYLRLIKFELIRLYEIQHSLRSLSYFDVYGRLRLTLALTRVTLEIPMVLDRAMRDELPAPVNNNTSAAAANGRSDTTSPEGSRQRGGSSGNSAAPSRTPSSESGSPGQLERRGLLGVKTRGMLVLTCKMLERAERWAGPGSSVPGAAGAAATAPSSQAAAAAQ